MGNEKKKVGPVVKASVETTTFISTVKQQLPKAQEKSEAPKSQPPALVDHKEMKKAGEASLGGNGKPPETVRLHGKGKAKILGVGKV